MSDAASNALFVLDIQSGAVSVLAGQRVSGVADGTGGDARFFRPRGVAFSPDGGTVYVADSANHVVRAVSYPEGVVTTLAGRVWLGIGRRGLNDGAVKTAQFSEPHDVAVNLEPSTLNPP